VLLGPACQLVLPPGTVATAHRSVPLPLFGRARDVTTPRPGRCRAARAVPRWSGPHPLSTRSLLQEAPHPGTLTSPLPHPPLLQKSRPPRHTLFSPPSLSSVHGPASRLSSTRPSSVHFHRHFPIWPPSPLSSSPVAPGASRSHRRPSLWRGRRHAPPHRAVSLPRRHATTSVSPASALIA
jgi:hypothetical protein